MKQLKVWLVLLLVFAAGFAGGAVVTRGMVRNFVRKAITNPEIVRTRVERDLNQKLQLDSRQRREVHRILVDSRRQLREVRQQIQPQVSGIAESTRKNIAAVLRPEQQKQFEQLQEEKKALLRGSGPAR